MENFIFCLVEVIKLSSDIIMKSSAFLLFVCNKHKSKDGCVLLGLQYSDKLQRTVATFSSSSGSKLKKPHKYIWCFGSTC